MDAHLDKRKKRNLTIVFLVGATAGAFFLIKSYLNEEKEKVITTNLNLKKNKNSQKKPNTKKSKLLSKKSDKGIPFSYGEFLKVLEKDKLKISKCRDGLMLGAERINEYNDIKVTDFNIVKENLLKNCGMRRDSIDLLQKIVEQDRLSLEIAKENNLKKPIYFILKFYDQLFKNDDEFQKHKKGYFHFLKNQLESAIVYNYPDFYGNLEIMKQFLNKCGGTDFSDFQSILDDFRRHENIDFQDTVLITQSRFELGQISSYIKRRSAFYSEYQERLRGVLIKFEPEFDRCIRE